MMNTENINGKIQVSYSGCEKLTGIECGGIITLENVKAADVYPAMIKYIAHNHVNYELWSFTVRRLSLEQNLIQRDE